MFLPSADNTSTLRADVAGEHFAVALWTVHGILDITRRHLDFVLAGFTDRPATTRKPALSGQRMTQIIRSSPLADHAARPKR